MRFRATEIAAAVGGALRGSEVDLDGVSIDSRAVAPGALFVPIVAERDGHQFVADAVRAGARAYLTSGPMIGEDVTAIVVADTSAALLDVGKLARSHLPDRVIGVTGSVGKTTVKDLTRAAVARRYAAHASDRSYNNELGVPLTLANAPEGTEATVVEMGARRRGHIALLCAIASPTIGVVTAVELAHAELFGSLDEVALAKGELVESLPADGVAVLSADRPLVASMATRTAARVLTFGRSAPGVDVTASSVAIDDELRASFRLDSPWGDAQVRLAIAGLHQVDNALAAAAAALACGVSPDVVAEGLAEAAISPWRMEIRRATSGVIVINDAYNANPASTEAALRSLGALEARRRLAVLGVMAELGEAGPAQHRHIAELARALDIDVVAVDAPDYGVDVVHGIEGAEAAVKAFGPVDGDAILVKGSRVAGLEVLASALSQ